MSPTSPGNNEPDTADGGAVSARAALVSAEKSPASDELAPPTPPARSATPHRAPRRPARPHATAMGWLTRFLASKMEDPAKRQAEFESHMVRTQAKCEEVCVCAIAGESIRPRARLPNTTNPRGRARR